MAGAGEAAGPARRAERRTLRSRVRAWMSGRVPPADTLVLTHRNVYILPTGAGLVFAATLVVLLLASINYQLNLGYLLTFLLAGSGAVSMHVTHRTLRGLHLHLRPPGPAFARQALPLEVVLTNAGSARHGIGLRLDTRDGADTVWVDVPGGAQASAVLRWEPPVRGRLALAPLIAETRFPLGLFRAWALWRPASTVLVYPAPEAPAAALPGARAAAAGQGTRAVTAEGGDAEGVRPWRRGDALNRIVWRKAARTLGTGGELVARDLARPTRWQLWLDWQACHPLPAEERLSRLAAWVLDAERQGASFGLRLPGRELAPAHGDAHRRQCLEALALWR